MDRRAFLASVAGLPPAVGAGCLGSRGGGQRTETPEQAVLEVLDVELVHEGEGTDTEARAEITAEAVADRALGQVVATATFVDDETLLESWVATVNGMDPGQRWLVSIRSGGTSGEDAAAVDDVQVTLEERTSVSALTTDRIEIVDEELTVEDDEARVEGVAENVGGERLEYATVIATFAGEDGVLLGKALTNTTRDVDPGQRFEFSIRYSAPVRPASAVVDCQLTTEATVEE